MNLINMIMTIGAEWLVLGSAWRRWMAVPIAQSQLPLVSPLPPFVCAAPTFLFFSLSPPHSPLRDTDRCSRWRMMLLCAAGGLVCHSPEKRSGAIGGVNYLPCCGELFALFPFPVNKFLRYSADQSKLTERM